MTRSEQAAQRKARAQLRAKRRFDPATRTARLMAKAAPVETAKHSALFRLEREHKITHAQMQAGMSLQGDWLGHHDSRVADLNPDRVSGGGGSTVRMETQAKHLQSYRAACASMGPEPVRVHNVVLTVCCYDRHPREMARCSLPGTTEDEMIALLKQGLERLCKFYGGGK